MKALEKAWELTNDITPRSDTLEQAWEVKDDQYTLKPPICKLYHGGGVGGEDDYLLYTGRLTDT
jgi:hypothetical protein